MRPREAVLTLVSSLSLIAAAGAQCATLPGPNGVSTGVIGDDVLAPITLSFPFTFPGGSTTQTIHVDTNGRIFPADGGGSSDPTETVAEFHAAPHPSIALHWRDMVVGVGAPSINVLDDGANRVLIEFYEWRQFTDVWIFTYQIELNSDGSFAFMYEPSNAHEELGAIVGCTPGNGHVDPGETDLSTIVTDSGTDPSVYQQFGPEDPFDLKTRRIDFLPNGGGGYTTVSSSCGYAATTPNGPTCSSTSIPVTVTFTPDGVGGYDVDLVDSLFDPNLGAPAGATSDDYVTATNLNLGFAFPFPGGVTTSFVDVDPNGRIVPTSAGIAGTVGDWSPSAFNLENDGYPMVCLWMDFDVTAAASDDLYFQTGPGYASFTWNDVAQFGTNALPLTTQIVLFADGTVHCTLEDVAGFNSPGDVSLDHLLVGVSDGVTTGTPELDLSAGPANSQVAAYEWFLTGTHVEHLDIGRTHVGSPPILAALTDPVLGGSWDLHMRGMPLSATFGFLMIGFAPIEPAVPLDSIGIVGCSLQVLDSGISFMMAPAGFGFSHVQSIPVPNDPAHIGLDLYVQGGSDGAPYAPLPVWFANSLRGSVGI